MHAADPDPTRVAETVAKLAAAESAPLSAFWLSLIGDRDAYATRLQPLLLGDGVVVLIVRQGGFHNPNALMADLANLLENNRALLLGALTQFRPDSGKFSLVLLAREELAIGQSSSPVIWPDWVPEVGNRQVMCFISDVTRKVDAPLDGGEVGGQRVNRALFAVEQALVRRLVWVHAHHPDGQMALAHAIGRKTDPAWSAVLTTAANANAEARKKENVHSFRPDGKKGDSIVSRIWQLGQDVSPRELNKLLPGIAAALEIAPDTVVEDRWDGLLTVLSRSVDGTPADRFCRNLVATVSAAGQFVVCAHHAGEYQRFPILLLTSVVDDLYRSLTGIEMSLNHLPIERKLSQQTRGER